MDLFDNTFIGMSLLKLLPMKLRPVKVKVPIRVVSSPSWRVQPRQRLLRGIAWNTFG